MRPTIVTIIIVTVLLTVISSAHLFPANKDYTQFNKGVSYILLKDRDLALQHIEEYFKLFTDPALRSCFVGVIEKNDWDVTKEFKHYLDINHRSTTALLGIALSTTDMENSTSMGNLNRAIRLESTFAAAYLCLGFEYMKQKNYPLAHANFNRAYYFAPVPEFKILSARLAFMEGNPAQALNLMKSEADRTPDNFYFNFHTAEAFFHLNRMNEMGPYIEAAIEVNPRNNEAQLLLAKYLLHQNELKRAKSVLKKIRFEKYNEEFTKIFGHVLLLLKDKQAKGFLDEVYSRKKWEKDINRLMGIYHLSGKDGGNVQNWINRAVLSGNEVEQLKKIFPQQYTIPNYKKIPFFDIRSLHWLSNDMILAVAIQVSGAAERIFFIRADDLKITGNLQYKGNVKDISFSQDRSQFIFTTSDIEEGSANVYGAEVSDRNITLKSIYPKALKLPTMTAGFNKAGNLVYFTNRDIQLRAFESPFSTVTEFGQKKPVYPVYPYAVFKYNFVTKSLSVIKETDQLENVPISVVKKYYRIYNAAESNPKVQGLIEFGQKLELTSSSIVRIFFAGDNESFLIYLSDLKNAFQAHLVDNLNEKSFNVDETMFLGEDQYAELTLLDFDPAKKELVVLTKGTDRTLIKFNYQNFLYTRLADKVLKSLYDKRNNVFYALTERNKKRFYTETKLSVIYQQPYFKKIIDERRDLEHILRVKEGNVYFSTIDGEMLKLDSEHEFNYIGPSFTGSVHGVSPSGNTTAAFINGFMYLVETNEKSDFEKWASKKNSKK